MSEAKSTEALEKVTSLLATLKGRLDLTEGALCEVIEQHRGAIQSIDRYAQRCPNSAQIIVNARAAREAAQPPAEQPVTTRSTRERYAPVTAERLDLEAGGMTTEEALLRLSAPKPIHPGARSI